MTEKLETATDNKPKNRPKKWPKPKILTSPLENILICIKTTQNEK